MRLLFLCGNESCHNYFIRNILEHIKGASWDIVKFHSSLSNLEYYTKIYEKENMSEDENEYLREFIRRRNKGFVSDENIHFENEYILLNGKSFNEQIDRLMETNEYEYILSYGVPIINNSKVLDVLQKSINLHFGLSRFYRGSETNIYALSRKEYDAVGLTAHKLAKKVDAGKALFEITVSSYQNINTINGLNEYLLKKAVVKLANTLVQKAFEYVGENPDAKLIYDKDLNIEHIMCAEKNLNL